MMEVLQMTSSDVMNEKAIRKHHRENILSYGETHNGIVPKYIVVEEARATLTELHPEWNDLPNWAKRSTWNDFYLHFKCVVKTAYGLKCMSKKHLRKKFGASVEDFIDGRGDKFFVFPHMTDNVVAIQGCEDMNHFENVNPNRRQAKRMENLVSKEKKRRAALPVEEQMSLLLRDMEELTGTDGAE